MIRFGVMFGKTWSAVIGFSHFFINVEDKWMAGHHAIDRNQGAVGDIANISETLRELARALEQASRMFSLERESL